jgi:2-hydroxychromene-2-carboxylate isomerase
MATIDYYLSLNSPWTYLGGPRLEAIARRHDAQVRVKPVNFGTIFPQTGGLPLPKRAPARQAYRLMELERWRRFLDMPLTLHPRHFPTPAAKAAGLVVAAGLEGGDPLALAQAVLRALWAEERDIEADDTLEELARATGHDAGALMTRARAPDIGAAQDAFTEEALARGVFGAPTYALGEELFWGQDRLDFLDRALAEA